MKQLSRAERYELFKRQVEWDGWSTITRNRFDDLFPETDDAPSIGELLGMANEGRGE